MKATPPVVIRSALLALSLVFISTVSACAPNSVTQSGVPDTGASPQTSIAGQMGAMGPGGMPPGGMRPGGPGGMPNMAEIEANYPELAAALKELEGLAPEERRTQMDALLAAHPEWQAAFPSPPPGSMGGRPPGGAPPSGFPQPTATAAP